MILLLGIGIIFSSASQYAIAKDGVGKYVSTAAPKGAGAVLPPGHFGLIAGYADAILSSSQDRASRFVTAAELCGPSGSPITCTNTGNYFILDMRSTYCAGHIGGAADDANIPHTDVAHPENLSILPMDMPIVVICGSGQTASFVTGMLQLMGYDAYALEGGYKAWTTAGFPVVTCP